MTNLKRFISYSLIIHLLFMSLLFLMPAKKEQKGGLFFARLVTPEEKMPRGEQTPVPRIPVPRKSPFQRQVPLPPRDAKISPDMHSKERPQSGSPEGSVYSHSQDGASRSSQGDIGLSREKGADVSRRGPDSGSRLKMRDLLDNEVIAKSAIRPEDKKEKSTVTFEAKEFKYYGYMQLLKDKIESIWIYPADAAQKGIYGDLYIDFTIKKDGSLGSVELKRTSGHRSLDDAAIKALKDAAPYWPLPEEWGRDGLTITGHFIYSLYGTYIR